MVMPTKHPSHPGEVFYWGVLEPLEISVSEAARLLGVRRATLSAAVNARVALSPELAIRIEKAFGPKADLIAAHPGRLRCGSGPQVSERNQSQTLQR
jgi:addiction module HigA family antidote